MSPLTSWINPDTGEAIPIDEFLAAPEDFQDPDEIFMPAGDAPIYQDLPLAQADEPLQPTLTHEPGATLGRSVSEAFSHLWSGLTGAPRVEGWDTTSDYMAESEDPRWQILHEIPPVELTYQLAHPGGHQAPSIPQTPLSGGDDMTLYGQPGYPGAPWSPYEGDMEDLPSTRTDPTTGRQYVPGFNPQQHRGSTILKRWFAGPRGGPRIQFIMFLQNGRKYIGCNRMDGSWKQWPVYRPLVIGKKMNDRKARRVAAHMDRYMKGMKKIARVLGYEVSRGRTRKS